MKKSERNLQVIENFILFLTGCSDEKEESFTNPQTYTPEELYRVAYDYIQEDHVDGKEVANDNITKNSKVPINDLKTRARMLIGDGENTEYVRGICELIGEFDYIDDMPLDIRSEEIREELLSSIRCNMCWWHGDEEDLKIFNDGGEHFKGCPDCQTDNYLMDLNVDLHNNR